MKCGKCLHCFVLRKKQNLPRTLKTKGVLENYITEGYSVRQLAKQKKVPEHRMRQDIQHRLDLNKIISIDEIFPNVHYLMIDGYALPKADGQENSDILLVYYEYIQQKVIWFSIRDGEKKEYIIEDLKYIKEQMGYKDIRACLSDGASAIISAIQQIYPEVIYQRCLVHIQRYVKTCLSNNPKTQTGRRLQCIVRYEVLSDPFLFPIVYQVWKDTYKGFLGERTETKQGKSTWTHKNLKKAQIHIENALPYMYQSIQYNDPSIERSTNKLE
jgi:hypothetical protein